MPELKAKTDTVAKENGVRLWAPHGNTENGDLHIALLSGHTLLISHEKTGTIIPKAFRKEALMRGAIPVGMDDDEPEGHVEANRMQIIREKMKYMLEADEQAWFTGDGKPKTAKLSELCGFTIDRNEANRAWDDLSKSVDGDDDDKPTLTAVGGK